MMVSTTGTSIKSYLEWLENELSKKQYGEVGIKFVVVRGQVVDVRKESVDSDHFDLQKKLKGD